jgi:hypothetical protein
MKQGRVNIVFPQSRASHRVFLEENNRRRAMIVDEKYWMKLSDDRWQITWKVDKPKLYENSIIRWVW